MKILHFFKWTTTWIAIWTMLISPVAAGRLAENVSKQQLQSALNQMGLNKKMTFGQFYQKNEYLYPERIRKKIKPYLNDFQNQPMPSYEVISSKNTAGEDVPVIRIVHGKQLLNMQWHGEPNRMFKFQNTNITEIDLINFDDMIERILAHNPKLRLETDLSGFTKQTSKSTKSKILKYPDITKSEWKRMTAFDRANYIVNLRLLLQDARQVLKNSPEKKKSSKTSQNFFEKNKYFIKLFFGEEAFAANGKDQLSNETCIIAGYVSEYENVKQTKACSPNRINVRYPSEDPNSLFSKANQMCSVGNQNKLACNPYIYGTPGGAPICVDAAITNTNLQTATHDSGACESGSKLSDLKLDLLKNARIYSKDRYAEKNLKHSQNARKELFKKNEEKKSHTLTQEYLLGLLKFHKVVKNDETSLSNVVMTDEIFNLIVKDKKDFDIEIEKAIKSCQTSTASPQEKNYWGACDQLHNRFLFVDEMFQAKCKENSLAYNPQTSKCSCKKTSGGKAAEGNNAIASFTISDEVLPGLKCETESITAPVLGAVLPAVEIEEKQLDDPAKFTEKHEKKRSEVDWKKIGIGALILGGIGLIGFGIASLVSSNKSKAKFPGDECPNHTMAPCRPLCNYPLREQLSGGCACDPCGEMYTLDAAICFCNPIPGSVIVNTQILTCEDSVTKVTDLSSCPDYYCWNGQTYKNPMNCPAEPQQVGPSTTPVTQ